jgi:NADPH-dependent 2,4-dienoyl-CoA reductase/sulfur reductase-like enzyme
VTTLRTVAVIGGSLAGLSAARALRSQGYEGRLTIVSRETHRPYDRPPLSKSFLAGTSTEADLVLEAEDEDLSADWRMGVAAELLDIDLRSVLLSDGTRLSADGLVIATGATPYLPWVHDLSGVHVLRTLEDCLSLRAELLPGARLVVVGAGFIGAEVASTARALGVDVTVVEAAPVPMSAALGAEMATTLSSLHADHGVRLLAGVGVQGLVGTDRVQGVALTDGRTVPADVVLVGVGVRPDTDWLAGSVLGSAGGVLCDAYGVTAVPGIVAVGDCATWYDQRLGRHHRLEHWTAARERAEVAVASLLSGGTRQLSSRPPYFWSDQYGLTLQMAGHAGGADSVRVEEGTIEGRDFLAVYRRGDEPVAVLAIGQRKAFMRWRRLLAAAASSSVSAL